MEQNISYTYLGKIDLRIDQSLGSSGTFILDGLTKPWFMPDGGEYSRAHTSIFICCNIKVLGPRSTSIGNNKDSINRAFLEI